MRWFEDYRIEWIKETIEIYGFMNREHLIKKFGITSATAASDFANVMLRYPNLLRYNGRTKRYEIVSGEQ